MTYFDNAATSWPKPPAVAEAMRHMLGEIPENAGCAGSWSARWVEDLTERVREKLAQLFDIPDPSRVIYTFNCTDALNMAIKGLFGHSHARPAHVVATVLEHNAVLRPLHSLQTAGRIEMTLVECDAKGRVHPESVRSAIRDETRLVVTSHASNVLGTLQDVGAIGRIVGETEALFLVDAAQTAGLTPISVQQMHIDLLALPGHKAMLGPTGTGMLYVGPRCPEPGEFLCWREGASGGDSALNTQPRQWPHYLEAGTPNTVGLTGLEAALDYLFNRQPQWILAQVRQQIQAIHDRFTDDPRVILYGPDDPEQAIGLVLLNLRSMDPLEAGLVLNDRYDMVVRAGLHCSPHIHRLLGTFPDGGIRISPGPFTTHQELVDLLECLEDLVATRAR